MSDKRADIDVFVCVVFAVERDTARPWSWNPGPLPIALPVAAARGRSGGLPIADRKARSSYFAPRIADALYAAEVETSTGRWHVAAPGDATDCARVEAWECLLSEEDNSSASGYAIAHLQLLGDPMAVLPEVTRRASPVREWLESSLPPGLKRTNDPRVGLVSHLTYHGAELAEAIDDEATRNAMPGWSAVEQWLWFTGTGVDPKAYLPDPLAPRPGTPIYLSADWRALALRNGVAYCALTPSAKGPHDLLRAYVRSVHLDGFLLVQLQSDAAHRLADDLSDASVVDLTVELSMTMEARLLQLRGGLWWRHLSNRGSQADQVVRALQDERGLPDLYEQLVAELTDTARFIELRKAREDQLRDRAVNQILSLVSAAFVTPSVFLAAVQMIPDPTWSQLVCFWVVAIALSVATWFIVRSWLSRSEGPSPSG